MSKPAIRAGTCFEIEDVGGRADKAYRAKKRAQLMHCSERDEIAV